MDRFAEFHGYTGRVPAGRSLAWFLDATCALLVAATWVLVSSGLRLELGDLRISVSSGSRAIAIVALLCGLRALLAPDLRYLFGWRDWTSTPREVVERLSDSVAKGVARLQSLTRVEARRLIAAFVVCAFGLRSASAWFDYGFFSGDDVEVLEMAFSNLIGKDHTAWAGRSAFFPLSFIYPPMKLLYSVGVSDPRLLFFSGRVVVVSWSVAGIAFSYLLGTVLYRSRGAGVVVAFCVAFAGVSTVFSGSELPRPIAGTLVLAALYLLVSNSVSNVARIGPLLLGGAILGVAASLRFSEIIFFLPLSLAPGSLPVRTRLASASVGILTGVVILTVADTLYWGDPFHSSSAIVEFTLLAGDSTRGLQPWYAYGPLLLDALGPVGLGLLVLGWCDPSQRVLLLWTALPLLLLSLLPHKEMRYLVPLIPLLMVAIGGQLWRLGLRVAGESPGGGDAPAGPPAQPVQLARSARPTLLAWRGRLLVLLAAPAFLAYQLDSMRYRRSGDAVDAARWVSREIDSGFVAFEQSWRSGTWLFLGPDVHLININTQGPQGTAGLELVLADPKVRYLGLRARNVARDSRLSALVAESFHPRRVSQNERPSYLLFERKPATPTAGKSNP